MTLKTTSNYSKSNSQSAIRTLVRLAVVLPVLALFGCALPAHNNTLIFGTVTKLAVLDASVTPSEGNIPNFTLGYKRSEAVWMPLVANAKVMDKGRTWTACSKETGESSTKMTMTITPSTECFLQGKNGLEVADSYSVLASFQGGFQVAKESSIAQHFATGLAARALAEKGGAALVNSKVTMNASANDKSSEDRMKYQMAYDIVMACVSKDKKDEGATGKEWGESRLGKIINQSDRKWNYGSLQIAPLKEKQKFEEKREEWAINRFSAMITNGNDEIINLANIAIKESFCQ